MTCEDCQTGQPTTLSQLFVLHDQMLSPLAPQICQLVDRLNHGYSALRRGDVGCGTKALLTQLLELRANSIVRNSGLVSDLADVVLPRLAAFSIGLFEPVKRDEDGILGFFCRHVAYTPLPSFYRGQIVGQPRDWKRTYAAAPRVGTNRTRPLLPAQGPGVLAV